MRYLDRLSRKISKYSPDDYSELMSFRHRMWPNRPDALDEAHWDWQFYGNPNNPNSGPEIWVFKDDGRILGQQATIPTSLKVGEKYYLCLWAIDCIVDPCFRNKGIGYLLSRELTKSAVVSLTLGISDSAYSICKSSKWIDMGGVPRFAKVLDAKPLVRKRLGTPIVSGVVSVLMNLHFRLRDAQLIKNAGKSFARIEQIYRFDKQFDEFWERVSQSFSLIARRDSKYLNWKYISQPGMNYTVLQMKQGEGILGYIVLRVRQDDNRRIGYIVDLLAMPDHFAPLIANAVSYFRKEKVVSVMCCIRNKDIEALLEELGFHRREDRTRFMMKANDPELEQEALRMKDEWFVTSGDSDMDRPWDN